jgi:hypothetical protein
MEPDNPKRLRAYLAAPFRKHTNRISGRAYGKVTATDYIAFMEKLESQLKQQKVDVCLPHRDVGKWGNHYIEPQLILEICTKMIDSCELFVALPEKSRGVHIELGYAIAKKKKILLLVDANFEDSGFYAGIDRLPNCRVVRYKNHEEVLRELISWVNTIRLNRVSVNQ